MKTRMPLSAGLLLVLPSLLFAQSYAETVPATAAKAVKASRPARVATTVAPAVAATLAIAAAMPPVPPEAPLVPTAIETQPPTPPAAPKAPVAATTAAPPAPPAPPRPIGQLLNVQVEVTLSDTKGTPKTVVLTVADGELGQNRTTAFVPGANNGANYGLNADARPTIFGNKIRLYLSAEASVPPVSLEGKGTTSPALSLRQQQTLILTDGDSVEVARAADPVSDRSFALSVKVKIQR